MTKQTTSRRLSSLAELGEAFAASAADQRVADQRTAERNDQIAAMVRDELATTAFQEAFGDPLALSIVDMGDEATEMQMPEPAEAQFDCGAIMATLFDLLRDTRLETSAQAIAWGS